MNVDVFNIKTLNAAICALRGSLKPNNHWFVLLLLFDYSIKERTEILKRRNVCHDIDIVNVLPNFFSTTKNRGRNLSGSGRRKPKQVQVTPAQYPKVSIAGVHDLLPNLLKKFPTFLPGQSKLQTLICVCHRSFRTYTDKYSVFLKYSHHQGAMVGSMSFNTE